jgi:hypothetical protein
MKTQFSRKGLESWEKEATAVSLASEIFRDLRVVT